MFAAFCCTYLVLQAWDDDWWEPFDDDKYPSLKKDPGAKEICVHMHTSHMIMHERLVKGQSTAKY